MTIICDASSLILLAKIGLLETLAKRNKTIISTKVYEETVKGKERGRKDAFIIEKLVYDKEIEVRTANKKMKENLLKLFNLKGGENETVALALKEKHNILTDDKKCMNVAKVLKIDFISSLDIVVVLQKKGVIDIEKALKSLNELENYGWYKKDIIGDYRRKIK